MSKKVSFGVTLMLMAMTAAVSVSITMIVSMHLFNLNISDLTERLTLYNKLAYVDSLIRTKYIGSINETTLSDALISGYIAGTGDSHAAYYSAENYQEEKLNIQGKGIGIGVTVTENSDGNIKVLSVAGGSPAETAKVEAGDVITKIGTQNVVDLGYDEAISMLKGNSGTTAQFSVLRDGKTIEFSVVRKEYETKTVEYRMIGNYGYIRITEFDENTDTQFDKALETLTSDGATGLIFDVRNDPGGELGTAENILDKLLPEGPIVSATYKDGKTTVLKYSDASEVNLPMAVLTNSNTASAAELFACDLKDYGKAKTVGTKTYGKGTMQETYQLDDGSAIKVTVAYFNPAKSANFDGSGVEPDIYVKLSSDDESNLFNLTDDADKQLQAAISYLNSQVG